MPNGRRIQAQLLRQGMRKLCTSLTFRLGAISFGSTAQNMSCA